MTKKILFFTLAGALAAPSAYAAQDTSGMRYTSAAEGFYASIRVRLNSGKTDNAGAQVENSSSRLGVRGSSDIGGGREFFYQYEMGVPIDNGNSKDLKTRIGRVGLRGGFGQIQAGSFWTQSYNWVHGSTDIANVHSGNLNYTDLLPGRITKAVEYSTPNIDGFQAAVGVRMDSVTSSEAVEGTAVTVRFFPQVHPVSGVFLTLPNTVVNYGALPAQEFKDKDDIDAVHLAGTYESERWGFSIGAAYTWDFNAVEKNVITVLRENTDFVVPAGFTPGGTVTVYRSIVYPERSTMRADHKAYAVKLGYARDNWYVNGWYSRDNSSAAGYNLPTSAQLSELDPVAVPDRGQPQQWVIPGPNGGILYVPNATELEAIVRELFKAVDVENMSFAAGYAMDKVNLYAVWEEQSNVGGRDGIDDNYTTIGAQYNFNAQSRVWVEYAGRDLDSDATAEDYFTIGLRHDF